jgi:hypothetical protein
MGRKNTNELLADNTMRIEAYTTDWNDTLLHVIEHGPGIGVGTRGWRSKSGLGYWQLGQSKGEGE